MVRKTGGLAAFVLGALIAASLDKQPASVGVGQPMLSGAAYGAPLVLANVAPQVDAGAVAGLVEAAKVQGIVGGPAWDAQVWQVAEPRNTPRKMNWATGLSGPKMQRVSAERAPETSRQRALRREIGWMPVAGNGAWICGASGAGQRSACTARN